jgi:hypothetical protein
LLRQNPAGNLGGDGSLEFPAYRKQAIEVDFQPAEVEEPAHMNSRHSEWSIALSRIFQGLYGFFILERANRC